MLVSALVLPVLLSLSVASTPQAQNPGLAATLALPISPGSIALLVEHPTDPAAQQRVREALGDARAEVRTVAARVVFTMAMRGVLPDVRAALAKEQDPIAGSEELRAWMTLEPKPETYGPCVDAALRLGYPAPAVLVDTFARTNAREVLDYVPRLTGEIGLINAIMSVTATDHAARAGIAQQLLAGSNFGLLDRLMGDMHKDGDHIPSEILLTLLRDSDSRVRMIGIYYVTICLGTDKSVLTPEVKAALDPLIEATATQTNWEAFGLELIARAEGRPARERRWLDLAKSPQPASSGHDGDDPLYLALTRKELADFFEVTFHSRAEGDAYRARIEAQVRDQQSGAARRADVPAWSTPNVGVRTVPPFVGGLWSDLLQLTGCQARRGFNIAADVTYRPDGRPARVSAGDTVLPEQCLRFAGVLFGLLVAEEPLPRPASFSDVVVLWLQPESLACGDRAFPQMVDHRRRVIERVMANQAPPQYVQPKKIAELPLAYNKAARERRLEGDVFVGTVLTANGCFSEASVSQSPSPLLSASALLSIIDWKYTPATHDGKPIPTNMGVMVHFRLSR